MVEFERTSPEPLHVSKPPRTALHRLSSSLLRVNVTELGPRGEGTEVEHDPHILATLVDEPVSHVVGTEHYLPLTHLVRRAIEAGDHGPLDHVDELLGVRMVVLADLVARRNRGDPHEAR